MCVVAAVLALTSAVSAQAPLGTVFTYQGQLELAGQPVNNTADFEFTLWDAESAGNPIGAMSPVDEVTLTDGVFTVQVNGNNEFGGDAFNGEARWLEIAVRSPSGQGIFTALAPRQGLSATPYAEFATRPWVTDGADISYAAGNVGIGTNTPAHPLDVIGDTKLGGRMAAGNDGEIGPVGIGDRIFDFSHTITDFSSALNWEPFRSLITLDSPTDLPNSGIYGHLLETRIPFGNVSNYNYVQGPWMAVDAFGDGDIQSLTGATIEAVSIGAGTIADQIGAFVFSAGGNVGGIGGTTIVDNRGLYVGSGHFGLAGSVTRDYSLYIDSPYHERPLDNHYGIYLENQDFGVNDSFAIYSAGGDSYLNGDLDVTGTLSKGAGSFKIDHPLDPRNRFLYHSFVESPDMMNIYNGMVVTDAHGYAAVSLPDWFDALNRDFRYQLTVIGQFAQAIVAEEIHDNRFAIRTDKGAVKVSWQVTGVRHDAYAEAHRIPVEADKPAGDRGTFLHPTEHGQPAERGIEAVRRARQGTSAAGSLSERPRHQRRGPGMSLHPAGLKPVTESAHTNEERK
jgi:hypothetical protein